MVLIVTVLAIALRVAWVLLVPTKPVGDFAMYIESAAHLVEHGSFDPEYVYMPGYIFLIAAVQALGGGWLATKLVGAVLGGLGAGAVAGIAQSISGGSKRVALIAGLLCACWPAGIAVASVTGTDMPAAALVVMAAYVLWRFAGTRPLLAAILFGLLTGFAATIRAIVVPLAVLSVLVFRAAGASWRRSLAHAALACAVAFVLLSPWALRNHFRYGETFFTDSHGGLTALVGANPNTDGCYSRGLNRMFRDVTGFTLLAEPHRQADRAALAIAKDWIGFDPLFTLGLLASKAERLLVHERALLYWPLFRASVLPEPERGFFARHQATIEAVADGFWLAVLALALAGCGVAYARRQWLALALLPPAAVLVALYTAIFSEPRYRMPISMLLMPLSALALDWMLTAVTIKMETLAWKYPAPRKRGEVAEHSEAGEGCFFVRRIRAFGPAAILGRFPNLPAMLRSRQSRLAPHATIKMETLRGFPNLPAMLRSRQSRLAPHAINLRSGPRPPALMRQAVFAAALPIVVFTLAPLLAFAGERLRAHHGWAVHECQVAEQSRFCAWRTVEGGLAPDGQPGVKGVWNGVGIALPTSNPTGPAAIAAEAEIPLAPGSYRLSMEIDVIRSGQPEAGMTETLTLFGGGKPLAPALLVGELPNAKRGEPPLPWQGGLHHEGGPLRLGARIETPSGARGTTEMGTLEGFPNPPATLRSRQSRLAPHATEMGTLEGFPNPPATLRSRQSRLAPHANFGRVWIGNLRVQPEGGS